MPFPFWVVFRHGTVPASSCDSECVPIACCRECNAPLHSSWNYQLNCISRNIDILLFLHPLKYIFCCFSHENVCIYMLWSFQIQRFNLVHLHTSGTSISYRTLLNSASGNNLQGQHLFKMRCPDQMSIPRFDSSHLPQTHVLGGTLDSAIALTPLTVEGTDDGSLNQTPNIKL